MNDKRKRGIGLSFAINGLKEAFLRERNFRIHLSVAVMVILFCAFVGISQMEWMFILLMIHLVLIAELINSLMERLIDYIKPDFHPQAKIIKDIAAAIVLLAAIASVIIGFIIFIPKLFI